MASTPRLDPAAVLPALKEACQTAGRLVASHYGKPVAQWTKADDSPVTEADTASHACITAVLGRYFPGVPVLSEEGDAIPYAVRRTWDQFFLVDPLDGTKGFLRRNGDFCVAIALVQQTRSTAGCIHIPVDDVLYAGGPGLGSEMQAHQILANSALDRLAHNAHQMIIEGESYRKKKASTRSFM